MTVRFRHLLRRAFFSALFVAASATSAAPTRPLPPTAIIIGYAKNMTGMPQELNLLRDRVGKWIKIRHYDSLYSLNGARAMDPLWNKHLLTFTVYIDKKQSEGSVIHLNDRFDFGRRTPMVPVEETAPNELAVFATLLAIENFITDNRITPSDREKACIARFILTTTGDRIRLPKALKASRCSPAHSKALLKAMS